MAKIDSKQRNVRLRNDSWFELAELAARWECKETQALERAIHEAFESGIILEADAPSGAMEAASKGDLQEMIGRMQGKPTVLGAVEDKYVKSDGRPMNFFEKREVDRRDAVAAKASEDKAAVLTGRDDVDYEAFND